MAGAGLGGRGQQRRRPAAGPTAARGRRAGRRRPGQARCPGPAVRHRPQPQDRRPRRALDRGGRGPHQGAAGAAPSTASSRRLRMLTDRREAADPAPGPDRRTGSSGCWPNCFPDRRRGTSPPCRPRRCSPPSDRATSPARPAAGSPPRSSPTWSRSRRRSRRPPPSSRRSSWPAAHTLMDLHGVGPVVAARVLADVGDVTRFADRNRFASWTGTAPLDASSGEQNRHRLSRAGNRRMNHMIHIAAISQIRLDTEGRAYYRRKLAAGKNPHRSHALPQAQDLRRHLPPARRRRPSDSWRAGPGGHCGATQESSAVDLPPHIDTSDQPLPGPAEPTLQPPRRSRKSRPRCLRRPVDNRGEPD